MRFVVCAVVLSVVPFFGVAEPSDSLTFEEALRLARRESLDLKRVEGGRALAEHDARALEKKDDPKLSTALSGTLKYVATPTPAAVAGRTGGRGSASGPGAFEMQYGIQGSTTLWDFGRMETESERAALLVREKESLIREQEEGLAFRVARAYLKVLGAQEMSDLALRQIENATRKYNQVQQNYQRGLRPEYDLVRAEVDLGRARVTKKSRDDELAIARLQLALLLALEDRMDVRLEGDLRRVPSLSKTLADSFAGPSVAAVFETRRLQRAANALEESAISAKLWPLVGASAGAAWSRGTTLPETGDSGLKTTLTGAVNVSWDIPWNGAYRDDSMRVALRDRELALSEEQELRTRREKSRLARTRLEVSVEQVALLEKQNLLSEKNLGIVRQKYDAGKASATELSVAEDEALNGQTELIRSRTSVAEALVDLAEANGVATVGSLFAKE